MNPFYKNIARKVVDFISLEKLRNKSVLITGANGILGSHMVNVIAHMNREYEFNTQVLCLSRNEPASWLKEIYTTSGITFRQLDLSTEYAPFDYKFDYIIHGATYGQPKKFINSAIETMRLNSKVTENLLQEAEKNGASFLFMSSSEIYGNPHPEFNLLTENEPAVIPPLDKRASYTISKVYSEVLCNIYNDEKRVRARIARVSSVYGPGVRLNDDRVLYVFINRALQSGQLTLMDEGKQKRKWLYIADALVMFFHILLHSESILYNVSGSEMLSIADIAQIIGKKIAVPVIFPDKNEHQMHTLNSLPVINIDNTKILQETGLSNLMATADGISETISWLKWLSNHHG